MNPFSAIISFQMASLFQNPNSGIYLFATFNFIDKFCVHFLHQSLKRQMHRLRSGQDQLKDHQVDFHPFLQNLSLLQGCPQYELDVTICHSASSLKLNLRLFVNQFLVYIIARYCSILECFCDWMGFHLNLKSIQEVQVLGPKFETFVDYPLRNYLLEDNQSQTYPTRPYR